VPDPRLHHRGLLLNCAAVLMKDGIVPYVNALEE